MIISVTSTNINVPAISNINKSTNCTKNKTLSTSTKSEKVLTNASDDVASALNYEYSQKACFREYIAKKDKPKVTPVEELLGANINR